MDNNQVVFEYTYSPAQQEEIRNIRKKYLPKEEDKMEQLRRLDRSVQQKGQVASLCLGVTGTLIFGLGMSCCLVWQEALLVPGIIIGLIGMAVLSAAYPVYMRVIKKERERLAPEILRLTEELLK